MRVTFNTMYDNSIRATSQSYAALSDAMDHTKYRVLQAADDPLAKGAAVTLNNALTSVGIFETASKRVENTLKMIETHIDGFSDRVGDIEAALIKAFSGENSTDDFSAFEKQLDAASEDLAGILNQKDPDGNYIFGGTKTDEPPFQKETITQDLDGDGVEETFETYVYKGNDETVKSKIGTTAEVDITIDGSKLIDDGNGGNIFITLAKAKHELAKGDEISEEVKVSIQEQLEGVTESIIGVKTDLGVNIKGANSNSTLYTNMKLEYTKMLSNEQDADLAQSIVDIQREQQMVQMIAQSTKKMLELTKTSFLD